MDVCVVGVTESEGETPLALLGRRNPFEPTADTVLTEEIGWGWLITGLHDIHEHWCCSRLGLSISDDSLCGESRHEGGRGRVPVEVGVESVHVSEVECISCTEDWASDLTVEGIPSLNFGAEGES